MKPEIASRNIILAGIPRSGTTLTCFLLNQLPNVVALVEPMRVGELDPIDHRANIDLIGRFFADQRASLLVGGTALGRSVDGATIDNALGDAIDPATGHRETRHNQAFVRVQKPLDTDFTLVLKHPSAFTALLPTLCDSYESFAIVRNPLAILRSWATAPFAVSQGHAPMAERFDRDLETRLARETAIEDRQVVLLLWFFEQYRRLGPHQIIRYEDVISSNAGILPAVFGIPHRLNHTLETRNRAHLGGTSYRPLAEKLIAQGGAYMDHYSAQEILDLASPSN
jgi:hypothetical protein